MTFTGAHSQNKYKLVYFVRLVASYLFQCNCNVILTEEKINCGVLDILAIRRVIKAVYSFFPPQFLIFR